jgi:YVTN family beta-propeller protein
MGKRTVAVWALGAIVLRSGGASAAPFAWIAHEQANLAARIDLATNEAVTVPVGRNPFGVAASRDGLRAYVTNPTDGTLSVIDAASVTVVATVPVGPFPQGVAVTPNGQKVYVGNNDGTISVVDTASDTVVTTVTVGMPFDELEALVMHPNGTRLYAGKRRTGGSTIAVLNTLTDTFTVDVPLSPDTSSVYTLAIAPDGSRLYAASLDATALDVIDTATNLSVGTLPLPGGSPLPLSLVVGADGSRLYLGTFTSLALQIIDTISGDVLAAPFVGGPVFGLDVTPDGSRVYAIARDDGLVSIVDTATNAVVGTFLTTAGSPVAFGDFISAGPTTSTSTSSTSTSSTSIVTTSSTSTTSTTIAASPPVESAAARTCQTALANTYKRIGPKVHKLFVTCFDRVLRDAAAGTVSSGTSPVCVGALDGGNSASKLARTLAVARSQAIARCSGTAPTDVASPCSPGAPTIDAVVDCILDRQVLRLEQTVAAEYGAPCAIATAAGLATLHPAICHAP